MLTYAYHRRRRIQSVRTFHRYGVEDVFRLCDVRIVCHTENAVYSSDVLFRVIHDYRCGYGAVGDGDNFIIISLQGGDKEIYALHHSFRSGHIYNIAFFKKLVGQYQYASGYIAKAVFESQRYGRSRCPKHRDKWSGGNF